LNATDSFKPGSQKAELEITILQVVKTAKLLEKAGVFSIEVSGGIREAGEVTVRTTINSPAEEAYFREYSKAIKKQ
jgi:isopropylmalate/homocitrate/citramalate synthase